MRELMIQQTLFVGFKADNRLRERLDTLSDSDRRYVSTETSAFLQICGVGEDRYVGKIVDQKLTTDQIEDICRNVRSIIRKLGHEARLPANLQILACGPAEGRRAPAQDAVRPV